MLNRERFVERADLSALHEAITAGRVDRELGIIRDVKLMGFDSLNGRTYRKPDPKLFEGVKIRLNHSAKEGDPDPKDPVFESIWGVAQRIEVRNDGVYGTIKYNPKHADVPSILWWAENAPNVGGFSPVMWGMKTEQDGVTYIEIAFVESVDLVDRPATTNGFFEEMKMDPKEIAKLQESLAAITAERDAVKAKLAEAEGRAAKAEGDLALANEKINAAKTLEARNVLLAPLGEVSEQFKEAVRKAPSDESAKALVEALSAERAAPRSASSTPADAAGDKGTVKAVESLEDAEKAGLLKYGA